MRIVFMGTPDFAVPSLQRIASENNEFEIVLVVTGRDKPRRKKNALPEPTPVKQYALELGLPVYETDDPSSAEFAAIVSASRPDVIVVAAFRILPPAVYSIARLGAFNLHASLLPAYRGAAPINWAIIGGDRVTGVTTFFLQEKVDTGSMILTESVTIAEDDNATMLAEKLSMKGAALVVETLRLINAGNVSVKKQNDRLASKAPKLTKENTRIRWDSRSAELCDFIRGLAMKPAAWTTMDGKNLKVYKAVPFESPISLPERGNEPGSVYIGDSGLLVRTADGWIALQQFQLEGKKIMEAHEFLRGFRYDDRERPLLLL